MSRIIILDGPDGCGKSTQARALASKLNAKYCYQPSGENLVGFIRKQVKENPDFKITERQLLHTVSHIVDAYEEINGQDLVFDRCFTSAWVYGNLMNLPEHFLKLLIQINSVVYKNLIEKYNYRVDIVIMYAEKRYNEPDNSIYEQALKWNTIKEKYSEVASLVSDHSYIGQKWFSDNQTVWKYLVNTNLSDQQITADLISMIQGE